MANRLWLDSGVPNFPSSISFLVSQILAKQLRGSLKRTEEILSRVRDDAKLRSKALSETVNKISDEIAALQTDLKEIRQGELKYRPTIPSTKLKRDVAAKMNAISGAAKQQVRKEIKKLIRMIQADPLEKSTPAWLKSLRTELQSASKENLDFETKVAAEKFATRTVAHVTRSIQPFLATAVDEAKQGLMDARSHVLNGMQQATEPVITRIKDRMDRSFKIRWSLPAFKSFEPDFLLAPPAVKESFETVEQPPERVVVFRLFWFIPVTKIVSKPPRLEHHFKVELAELRLETEQIIARNFQKLSTRIDAYLERQLQSGIEEMLDYLNEHFERYKKNLEQARQDHQLTRNEQESKRKGFESISQSAAGLLERCQEFRQKNEDVLRP
jgi:hypothetical protein